MSNAAYYRQVFYPFQDRVLRIIRQADTPFYLTGGTAASRGYLQHRFSDDLDFFVNDDPLFSLWVDRVIHALRQPAGWKLQILQREARFARLVIAENDLELKLEFINDVPAHVGKLRDDPLLGWLDSPENILANKITALIDREEPKDLADIWAFCCRMGFSIHQAIHDADSKAAGIFPADLARILCQVTEADWQVIRWIEPPPMERFLAELNHLGESLLLPPVG